MVDESVAFAEQVRWFSLFHPMVGLTGSIASALILYYASYQLVGPGVADGAMAATRADTTSLVLPSRNP